MSAIFAVTGLWTATAAAGMRDDYDVDNDGLVEIEDLDDLDAIRDDPFGTSLYGSTAGCPAGGCHGFELAADLDFDENGDGSVDGDDDHIVEEGGIVGWVPIPTLATTFEGNNRTIRNLKMHWGFGGLFGELAGATVRNLRIAQVDFYYITNGTGVLAGSATTSSTVQNVSVEGGSIYVNGESYIGGLLGNCFDSHIQESRTFLDLAASGWVGGLIGNSDNCTIARSFARGRTTSARYHSYIGGLVGWMIGGSITDSYMTGTTGEGYHFGGLVGFAEGGVTITNSFVSGAVVGSGYGGGALVGAGDATIVSSFYATDTTGYSKTAGSGGTAVTLADLKCTDAPSDPDCLPGLFAGWQSTLNSNGQPAWDFGNNQQVPALRIQGVVYRDNDGDGLLNAEDQFPNRWAASLDSDNDGAIDFWREGCDAACRAASNLVLDQFPNQPAASLDLDLDTLPDAWNPGCNSACQAASMLTLDTHLDDFDNDGIGDLADQDDNNDGIPDVDLDSDNLIDISDWVRLDQMRFDPTGASLRSSAEFPEDGIPIEDTSGCRPRVVRGILKRECDGYELLADLDFDTDGNGVVGPGDAFWNDGNGWWSVGHHGDDWRVAFQTNFEGNGHVIYNLFSGNPAPEGGLFGGVRGANIRNLGLDGPLMSITGSSRVGGLVGDLVTSTITNCYSTGTVTTDGGIRVGGLIGEANGSVITGVFSSGDASSIGMFEGYVGGLIGSMGYGATLTASFASGAVSNQVGATGGLVGSVDEGVAIAGSYSIGAVNGPTPDVGGLIGRSVENVVASYWATDTSTRSTSAGGAQPATVAQLSCPVGANDTTCRPGTTLFSGWAEFTAANGAPYWEQGTATQLPGLCVNGSLFRPDSAGDLQAAVPCACVDNDQQLVTNQGFEANTNGWTGSSGTSISSSTLAAHSGARSLRVANRNTGSWQGAEYSLLGAAAPGESLAVSLWARVSGDPSEPVLFTLRSVCQGGGTVYTNIASATATDTGWVQLQGTIPVPNCTLTELVGYAEGPRTGVVLYIDDVSITRKNLVCQGGGGAPLTGSFIVTTDWGSGYCVELRVTNPGATATTNWSATFNLNGTTIYDKWNINTSASSGNITVTPFPGFRVIAPGTSSHSLGFCANRPPGSTAFPTGLAVTGTF